MTARYRAEHVGSLLRPVELLRAREAHANDAISADELLQAEDEAILEALRLQHDVGLEIFSDGEFRRGSWLTDMAEAVDGFVAKSIPIDWRGPGGGTEPSTSVMVGARLQQKRRLTGHEVPFLKQHAPGPFKVTLPSPSVFMLASYMPGLTDRAYAGVAELMQDLVSIIRSEVNGLVSEGVPYVQLDAPQYAWYLDRQVRDRMRRSGIDPDKALDQAVAGDNACLEEVRGRDVMLAMHICRGNNTSRWFAEGSYDAIAEKLFGGLAVDAFLLEYDTERAGTFEPLRFVPRGKTVVLGLITTKSPQLETVDELSRRIDAAARYVQLDNLALSPQCGFASVARGNLLSLDDQRRKLEVLVETVRKVWG